MSTRFANSLIFTVAVTLTSLSTVAHAWGERGHFLIGYTAARLFETQPTKADQEKLGVFFSSRTIMFGHLSNIPDISWRDPRHPAVAKANDPNHHFDVEYITGRPDGSPAYLNNIRHIEPNLALFLKKYKNQPSALNPGEKIDMYSLGSGPFRAEQLYNGMVAAFRCAKSKEISADESKPNESWSAHDTFRFNMAARKHFHQPLKDGTYRCTKKTTRLEDLAAAVELGGVMSHFVGDLAQPFHVSADYDGWATGHGGIHAYFETYLLQYLDEKLENDVLTSAQKPARQKQIMNQLDLTTFKNKPIPTIIFHLIADSFSKRKAFYAADDQSIIRLGTKFPLGVKHPKNARKAVRKDFRDPSVQAAYRPLIVERLTVASYLLYKLWYQAWIDGGRPDVHDASYISMPYPLNVPFVREPKGL